MQPRFLGLMGLADVVTVANAALGFVAAVVAFTDPQLAARLILLAAIADGLDGVVARARGGSDVGEYLDSLADVASFGVAPGVFVYVVATDGGASAIGDSPFALAAIAVPALYVAMAVVRLGLYMRFDRETTSTEGVQTTLAGTILAVAYLAGITDPVVFLAATAVFTYLMVAPVQYPELYARDAIVLGGLQAVVIAAPTALDRVFPRTLLLFAVAYLVLAPFVYWRDRSS